MFANFKRSDLHATYPPKTHDLQHKLDQSTSMSDITILSIGVLIMQNIWRRGVVVSGVRCMNEVNPRRARLVPGWVTVFGWVYHLGM